MTQSRDSERKLFDIAEEVTSACRRHKLPIARTILGSVLLLIAALDQTIAAPGDDTT